MLYLLLALVGVLAGAQNALAGGGSFLTFPALLAAGMGARAANITSTVALFPGQIATALAGRGQIGPVPGISMRTLWIVSLVGGALGALLLLTTPESVFSRLVPFLVLFATAVFAWGSFFRTNTDTAQVWPPARAAAVQFAIAVYGGYFGGGVGILMLAALTLAGLKLRAAGATKNVLNAVQNASAVLIFCFSPDVHWASSAALGAGSIAGGQAGAWLMLRVNQRALRVVIIAIGLALSAAMFFRG